MTEATKISQVKRAWHLIDLKDKTLGRVSTEIAKILMGKAKSYFVRNLDCGDYIVAINAKYIKFTGNKGLQKKYYRYSGYPGGLRVETLEKLIERRPEEVTIHAVKGMLPQNKLRDSMLKRLYIFPEEKHDFEDKLKNKEEK